MASSQHCRHVHVNAHAHAHAHTPPPSPHGRAASADRLDVAGRAGRARAADAAGGAEHRVLEDKAGVAGVSGAAHRRAGRRAAHACRCRISRRRCGVRGVFDDIRDGLGSAPRERGKTARRARRRLRPLNKSLPCPRSSPAQSSFLKKLGNPPANATCLCLVRRVEARPTQRGPDECGISMLGSQLGLRQYWQRIPPLGSSRIALLRHVMSSQLTWTQTNTRRARARHDDRAMFFVPASLTSRSHERQLYVFSPLGKGGLKSAFVLKR